MKILFLFFCVIPSLLLSQQTIVCHYGESGFFAVFASILATLDLYETEHYDGIMVDFKGGQYLDPNMGSNWWEHYFEPIKIGNPDNIKRYITFSEYVQLAGVGFFLERNRANNLIQKYIHVKPHILDKVDTFIKDNFENGIIIGVHHRGTDKITEMPLVPYEATYAFINYFLQSLTQNQLKTIKIYVATDEKKFLNYMLNKFPGKIIYNNFVRSVDDNPIHFGNDHLFTSNYQKGEEALIDCLLLSRCHVLFRPQSSLSIASDKFNPNLPVFIVH